MFSASKSIRTAKGMAEIKLIGTDTPGNTNLTSGYVLFQKFTADASGTLNNIEIYPLVNSNVRVGIYSENASTPNVLLTESSSTAVTSGAWARIPVPGVSITSGTIYWLACTCETTGGCSHTSPSNTGLYRYVLRSYQALPGVASGTSTAPNYLVAIRGYQA